MIKKINRERSNVSVEAHSKIFEMPKFW